MIYIFAPYFNKPERSFYQCIENQIVKLKLIRYDRKAHRDYWSYACNYFLKEMKRYRGIDPDDVVCIMNVDIIFGDSLMKEGATVKDGEILIPYSYGIKIDWKRRKFLWGDRIDTFPGRCFFMKVSDFLNSGGFSQLLPHYLSDYEFGIRMIQKGMKVREMFSYVYHKEHSKSTKLFSVLCPANPIFWTIFILKCCKRKYIFINLLKSWGVIFKNKS
jgi:GT2 family glycosyltransferase